VTRTPEEIQGNMFRRLIGDDCEDLIAHYASIPVAPGVIADDRALAIRAADAPTAVALPARTRRREEMRSSGTASARRRRRRTRRTPASGRSRRNWTNPSAAAAGPGATW
jgi:hypothetical protein